MDRIQRGVGSVGCCLNHSAANFCFLLLERKDKEARQKKRDKGHISILNLFYCVSACITLCVLLYTVRQACRLQVPAYFFTIFYMKQ